MKTITALILFCGFACLLQAQVSFTLSASLGVGGNPSEVVSADVNGDGKLDLISVDEADFTLSVLTNNGTGGFAREALLGIGLYPVALTAADLNGDGRPDLIAANNWGNTLSIYTNNGGTGFVLASTADVGAGPWAVRAVDLNGDGKLELISANADANTLAILTNNGSCGFSVAAIYSVGSAPHSIAVVDVNGDGRLDFVTANYGGTTLSVLTNNGSGGFVAGGTYTVGSGPFCVVSADLNGDGKPDLISANNSGNSLSVLTNNGSGGFAAAGTYSIGNSPRGVVAVDVNGDGWPDLASADTGSSQLTVYTNDGSGGFLKAGIFSAGGSPNALIAVDINGDGKLDMVTPNYANNLSLLTNGTPFPPAGPPVITTQPVNQTNVVGGTTLFNVGVGGTAGPLWYQWRFSGTNLPAATNSSVSLTNLTLSQAGYYDVVITNSFGSVTSSPALLDVRFILAMVSGQPAAGTVTAIAPATLTILGGYPGGFIFYTLDGSTPTSGSEFYTGPVSLTNSVVVRTLGMSADFSQSQEIPPVVVQIIPTYTLQTSIIGSGALATNPPGGLYASNTVVTLTATSPSHWAFDHWSGDAAGSQNPVSVTMNGPRNVQANFVAIPTFSLQTSVIGNGVISVVPSGGPYDSNTVVKVTATPGSNWRFDHWAGDITSALNPINVTMNSPISLQAVFVQTAFPLTLSTPGGGSVTANGLVIAPATYYPTGIVVVISANTNAGWKFLYWRGSVTGTNNPLNLVVSQTNVIQAVFGTTAGTNSVGGGIVLSQPNPIPYGTSLTASAVPDPGNYFVSWLGTISGTNSPATNLVTSANPSLGALFAPLPAGKFTLSVMVNGSGMVTNNPRRSYYNSGDTVTLRALTNSSNLFQGWTQDAAGTNNPLTFVMTTNKLIQANFGLTPAVSLAPSGLTLLAGSNGLLSANALGLPPLTYQWQGSQGPIAGATNAGLLFFNVQPSVAGNYFVVVTNLSGSVTSAMATVTVIGTPVITNQPAAATIVASGHAASFGVGAYGWPALAYQWLLDGVAVSDATNATLAFANAFPADGGSYTVVITNVYGSVTSNPALLTVLPFGITTPLKLSNGGFQFTFDTASGLSYQVEYSTNLTDWHPLMTVGGNGAPLTMIDPNTAGSAQRYYRIFLSP